MGKELWVRRADGAAISLAEWQSLVESDPALQWRTAPSQPVDPDTGENLAVREPYWEAEYHLGNAYVPLLRYSDGVLRVRLAANPDRPEHPVREKISQVAAQLNAEVGES